MIQSDRSAPHWRLALALGAMSLLYVVFALTVPSSAQAGTPYCGIWVPANTDCANVAGGSWVNGYFNQNLVESGGGFPVCEHTYIAGGGTTVSRHCGGDPENAGSDLACYFNDGYELSAHAGDDFSYEEYVAADAYVESGLVCT